MKKFFLLILFSSVFQISFAQTRKEMVQKDLPKNIQDYVRDNMKSFEIAKAFKVDSKGVLSYELQVVKGDERHLMTFDKDGKFLKKSDMESKPSLKKIEGTSKSIPPPSPSKQGTQPPLEKKTEPKKK